MRRSLLKSAMLISASMMASLPVGACAKIRPPGATMSESPSQRPIEKPIYVKSGGPVVSGSMWMTRAAFENVKPI